jgi:hypothetical protein
VKALYFVAAALAFPISVLAQEKTSGHIYIKGIVLSATDLAPVRSATVMVEGCNYGAITDSLGYFRMRVESAATLRITHISFQKREVKIDRQTAEVVVLIHPDSSTLANVTVRRLDGNQFERDFINLKVNDSLKKIASENTSQLKLQALRYTTATNGSDSYSLLRQKESQKQSLSNRVPYFSMLDLVVWYKILKKKKKKVR